MRNKIILDFAVEPSAAITEVVDYGRRFGVIGTVTLMRGPTGWPVVEFTGGWAELDALLVDYYQGSDHEETVRCRYAT